jgi:hypothetical protein
MITSAAGGALRVRCHPQAGGGALCRADVRLDRCGPVAALPGRHSRAGRSHRLAHSRLAGLAAAGLAADMAGATIINAAVLHSSAAAITVPLCAAFALLACCRWQQARILTAAIGR